MPYVVRQEPGESGLGGMTSSAAARRHPAVIAEAGGCGQLEEAATTMLVDGVRNVLRHLEMLPGTCDAAARGHARRRRVRLAALQRTRAGGSRRSLPARRSTEGSCSGPSATLYGDVLEEVHAARDGVVLFLTTSPAVADDGLLLGLGAEFSPA